MKRLTERDGSGCPVPKELNVNNCACQCIMVCEAYEDVREENICIKCPVQHSFSKLADYEDAEEQGRLIEIPANYKDAVFSLDLPHLHISQLEFYGMELMAIGSEDESRYIVAGKNGCTEYFNAEHIGETIFFSNEEAEAKLKEMEADNHGDT